MNSGYIVSASERILITGSNGFVGTRVVAILLEYGYRNLRCFTRSSSQLGRLNDTISRWEAAGDVEIISGDLLSAPDCRRASEGVSVVLHLAAGFDKSFAGAFMNSALATRNLMDAVLAAGQLKRFVNISSFAVYSNLHLKRGALLDETCLLESAPQERFDAYGFGKLKQEELVREYGKKHDVPWVILRPGAVFGPGKKDLSGRVGINTFGFFLHLGGANEIPLTFVDNCAEAIVLAGIKPDVEGKILNVVDDELLTSRQLFRAYKRKVKPSFSVSIPYFATRAICRFWEIYSKWSKGQVPPVFNRRRCAAEWKGNRYSNRMLKQKLGWEPRVPMDTAVRLFLAQCENEKAVNGP